MYVLCLFALVLMGTAGRTVYRAQNVVTSPVSRVPEEIQVSRQMIRQSIREEFRTSFAPVEETVVERLSQNKIRVSGWVDVILDNGISDRQNYSIVVSRNGAGEWVGENATVLPQM